MITDYKKSQTFNFGKAFNWIEKATKSNRSTYFRFVGYEHRRVYGEWLTPEMAMKGISKHNEHNTLLVERRIYQ